MKDKIKLYNEDCLQAMRLMSDKQFDLAIVDPPYGIGAGSKKFINGTSKTVKDYYKDNDWDKERPSKEYFEQLKRISKNQIVWGGNYFADYLGAFRCFIFWDKTIHGNSYADGEMAWTSYDKVARYYRKNIAQVTSEGRMHSTQKPVTLYEFILKEFSTEGDKIIDTHLGSGSIALAAHNMGYELTGFEIDKDYYDGACKRLKVHKQQLRMF